MTTTTTRRNYCKIMSSLQTLLSAASVFALLVSIPMVAAASASGAGAVFTLPLSHSDMLRTLMKDPTISHNQTTYNHLQLLRNHHFSSLNQIFSKISLTLPDAIQVSQSGLDLTISQLSCNNLQVHDIQLQHWVKSNTTEMGVTLNVYGLHIDCTYRWEYAWTVFNGAGSGTATLDDNDQGSNINVPSLSVDLSFFSEDYNYHPPNDVTISNCHAENMYIADMNFDGDGLGFIGSVVNLFESMLRDTVANKLRSTACEELQVVAQGGGADGDGATDTTAAAAPLDKMILLLHDKIETYLTPLDDKLADPLSGEKIAMQQLTEDELSNFVNFQGLEDYAIGGLINTTLVQVRSFLGTESADDDGEQQLRINDYIRNNWLNKTNGRMIIDPSFFPSLGNGDGVIYKGHDMLTETIMTIQSIEIEGLDSISEIDVLRTIGNHTLRNTLKLDYLSILMEMEVVMKASSKSDAIIVAPDSPPITERFTIDFNATDVEIDLSAFLGINMETLGNLELGPMLHSKNILPCLLSSIDVAKFTGLSLSVGNIDPPRLSGFIDDGIDQLMSSAAISFFEMYERVLIKAMPNFFQSFVRNVTNGFLSDRLSRSKCPTMSEVVDTRYVDFRDLFQSSTTDAELFSGSVNVGRYGDVVPRILNLMEDTLLSPDEDGLLAINEMIIAPWTKTQSGLEGEIKFNRTVDLNKEAVTLNIWKAFADNLRLKFSDFRISGLDTFLAPVKVLQPRPSSAYLLENQIRLGVEDKPVEASFKFAIEIGGSNTPLAMNNVLDLQFSMPSVEILAVLFATVRESRLMNFPLKDITNSSCWMSMIPVSANSSGDNVGMRLDYLDVIFDILASTKCVSCSNVWLEDLNSIVEFLDDNEFISGLQSRALSIGSDIMHGDWMQGLIDKRIIEASRLCPHDESFGSVLPDHVYPTFGGTRSLVDGILYASFPMVQMIAIIIAQKHSGSEISPPVDLEVVAPKNAKLIDFTDLSSIAGWADMALSYAQNYLGGTVEISQQLGITSILRSTVLNSNGLLTIPIVDQGFEAGSFKLSLNDVALIGLDSFIMFDILEATGPNTFSNSLKLHRLGVTLKMDLWFDETNGGNRTAESETVTISLILNDVEIEVSVLMAMDQDLLGELMIGSLLNTKNVFPCLLSATHSVGLSEFVMNVGDIEEFSISGIISDETDQSLQRITSAIFDKYKQIVLNAWPVFTSTTARPILHNILQVLLEDARNNHACPKPDTSLQDVIDFRDLLLTEERAVALLGQGDSPYGNLFRSLFSFLETKMSDTVESGLSRMNDLVGSLTRRQSNVSGDLYYPGYIFQQELNLDLNGLNADIELGISDLRISNLDSLGSPITVLQPVLGESSVLNNSATIAAGSEALRTELRLLFKADGSDLEVHNDLVMGLNLMSIEAMLEILVEFSESPFLTFPLRDIMNLNCWLSTIVTPILDKYGDRAGEPDTGMAVKSLAMAVAEASLDIDCIECSSPLIVEMASIIGSKEAIEDTTDAANMIFNYISNLLGGDFTRSKLDRMLADADRKCPHSPSYDSNYSGVKYAEMEAPKQEESAYGFLIAIVLVIIISALVVTLIYVVTRNVAKRRHGRWMETLNIVQKLELAKMQRKEKERETDVNAKMSSLVRSKEVPLFFQVFVPVMILGNVALFVSGHLSIAGTVNISGSFAGEPFNVDGFYEFSLVKSLIEMWIAGARSLAVIIAIFSGVWPYTKQLMVLFIWFVPTKWVSSKRRSSMLYWLDVLGKWSMVDVFVFIMTLASFGISIQSPDNLSFLPSSLYSINMLVVPLWGLYAYVLAILISQLTSHAIIHYHNKSVSAAVAAQLVELNLSSTISCDAKQELRGHQFKLDYEASDKRVAVKRSIDWVLSGTVLTLTILVICGCAFSSFSIEVFGLVGLAVESGHQFQQAKVSYSIFSLANMIMDQARYLNTASDLVGLGTLAALVVITVFLVPLAQAASLMAHWFVPMTKKQRSWNLGLNEVLYTWQYMEVYVISIIITSWQLGGISGHMINVYCGALKETFSSLAYYGILKAEDAQCFRVDAIVDSASWVLVAASILLCMLNHFVVGASMQKTLDDNIPPERRLHTDRWVKSKLSAETVESGGSEEEEFYGIEEPSVSPVVPRFTDYYFFATSRIIGEAVQCNEVETGVAAFDD